MIEVAGLVKYHQADHRILDGLSFSVEKGETIAVVGPSGGGKTTLLRCLHALDSFNGGSIEVAGAKLAPGSLSAQRASVSALRRKAGFVFQTWHLFAHMTVLQNVIEAPVHVKHVPKKQAIDRAKALLDKVGLTKRIGALPKSLSGGEQQRAAIARALAMEPEVLMMDEPTSALDPERVSDLGDLLTTLKGDGLTLVMVTHEISFARRIADRALVLIDGKLALEGKPSIALENPSDERIRRFLGLD